MYMNISLKFEFSVFFIISDIGGDYWRLLLKGSYTIHVSAPGFKTSSEVVTVRNNRVTKVDFQLESDRCSNKNREVDSYFDNWPILKQYMFPNYDTMDDCDEETDVQQTFTGHEHLRPLP